MGTITWTTLRRQLSRRLREPIFRRSSGELTVDGSTNIVNFYDAALSKYTSAFGIPYGFAYVSYTTDGNAPLGEELEITSFASDGTTGYVYMTPGPSAQLAAGDKVEIHEIWTVAEKAEAINQAARDCWPAFYDLVVDETLIVQKFKRSYDLTGLAVSPRHLVGAYVEPIFRIGIGNVVTATSSSFTANIGNPPFETGKIYKVAIYYGTGAGQEKTIDSDAFVPGSNSFALLAGQTFSPIPDTTSEFMIKNTSDVYYNWLGPITRIRLDKQESPTAIEILYDTYEIWGARLRLVYAANITGVQSETSQWDDNIAGYLIPRAMYHLYLNRIGSGPQFEVKTAATLADSYMREADTYRDQHRMKRLGGTIKTEMGYVNWSDREMPFKR